MQIVQEDRATSRSVATVAERLKGKVAKAIEIRSMDVELLDPSLLKPNAYNPNKQEEHEFELLRQSIRSDGFTMPVLANKDLTIIDGEHRWRAAIAEGLKLIPVVRLDLDEARMKIATIRHNKATGSHDAGLEALVLADLERLVGAKFIEEQLHVDQSELQEILNFTNAPDMLAGEEYGLSWAPVKHKDSYEANEKGEPVASPVFSARLSADKAVVMRSSTNSANALTFNKIVKKDNEAGRQALYTVSAIFVPEEATLVQKVLESLAIQGETPAERLLTIVKASNDKEGATEVKNEEV